MTEWIFEDGDNLPHKGRCPICAALILPSNSYSIEWLDDKREFRVKIRFACEYDGAVWASLEDLPVTIAQKSRCKCGSDLSLSNYKFNRNGDEIVFEGSYVCEKCGSSELAQVNDLKHKILNFWKKTTAIEVGPTGVRYEKAEE